eukprot:TRINITY_DN4941_c0_g1_i1.p1 TRINITY_DN4941_c0_g1~~TRINITY_DN4941_c0_g1_i1.p1  ORF type:complete len:747 (-),score=145.49 TRINITY_DN4941_c0_g1_i1:36-2276(-)
MRPLVGSLCEAVRPPVMWPPWFYPVTLECVLRLLLSSDYAVLDLLFQFAQTYLTCPNPASQLVGLLYGRQLLRSAKCRCDRLEHCFRGLLLAVAYLARTAAVPSIATSAFRVLSDVVSLLQEEQVQFLYEKLFPPTVEERLLSALRSGGSQESKALLSMGVEVLGALLTCFFACYTAVHGAESDALNNNVAANLRLCAPGDRQAVLLRFVAGSAMVSINSGPAPPFVPLLPAPPPPPLLLLPPPPPKRRKKKGHKADYRALLQRPLDLGYAACGGGEEEVAAASAVVRWDPATTTGCVAQLAQLQGLLAAGGSRLECVLQGPLLSLSLEALPFIEATESRDVVLRCTEWVVDSAMRELWRSADPLSRRRDALAQALVGVRPCLAPRAVCAVVARPATFGWLVARTASLAAEIGEARKLPPSQSVAVRNAPTVLLYNILRLIGLSIEWCQVDSQLLNSLVSILDTYNTDLFDVIEQRLAEELDGLCAAGLLDVLFQLSTLKSSYRPRVGELAHRSLFRVYTTNSSRTSPFCPLRLLPRLARWRVMFPRFPPPRPSPTRHCAHVHYALSLCLALSASHAARLEVVEETLAACAEYDADAGGWPQQRIAHSHDLIETMNTKTMLTCYVPIVAHVLCGIACGFAIGRQFADPAFIVWALCERAVLQLACLCDIFRNWDSQLPEWRQDQQEHKQRLMTACKAYLARVLCSLDKPMHELLASHVRSADKWRLATAYAHLTTTAKQTLGALYL